MVVTENWIRSYEKGIDYVEHLDGIDWMEALKPWRWHRCKPQSRGIVTGFYNERCACGAIRPDDRGPWILRNSK